MEDRVKIEHQALIKELNELQQELYEFKNIISLYLDKYISDVDNITPEDLEYSLSAFAKETLDRIGFSELSEQSKDAYRWKEIYTLYKIFNPDSVAYANPENHLKIFIKNLVRNNKALTQENEELKKLL